MILATCNPRRYRTEKHKNISYPLSKNAKKSPPAPSAPPKRVGSGGAGPPERCHGVGAIEASEFAIGFASYIEGDTGVLIILIGMAALPKRWAAVLGAYYWG